MSHTQYYNPVSNYFRAKGITVPPENEWMQGCVDFCLSENRNANLAQIQEFVYDQWLLADLCDVGVPCLPPNLAGRHFSVLQGSFPLQVNEVLNVGQSSYSQLQKVRKVATENTEVNDNKPTAQAWEPKSGRMLRLTATDGIQKVFGMEYKPIKALQEPFVPGFKIVVKGPVECRKGVLLLEEKHLTVFGGEVDNLVIQNALENLLLKSLNLQTVANPVNKIGPQTQAADVQSQYYASQAPAVRNQNVLPPAPAANPQTAPRTFTNQPYNANNRNNSQTRPQNDTRLSHQIDPECFDDFLDDDDDLLAMHLDQVAAAENNALNNSQLLHSDEDEAFLQVSDNLLGGGADHYSYHGEDFPSTSYFNERDSGISTISGKSEVRGKESESVCDKVEPSSNPNNPNLQNGPSNHNLTNRTSQTSGEGSKNAPAISDVIKSSQRYKVESLSNPDPRSSQTLRLPDLPFLKRSASSPLKDRSEKVVKNSLSARTSSSENSGSSGLNLAASFFEWSKNLTRLNYVKASVVSLASKLKIKERKWIISAMISDGAEEIKVDFSPEVLEKLVGHSAAEIHAKRDEIEKDPILKLELRDVLTQAKKTLLTLKATMKIELPNLLASPVITDVIEDS